MIAREEILQRINELPLFPEAAARVIEWYTSGGRSVSEIADYLETKTEYVSNILCMANTEYFNSSRPYPSIPAVIEGLGIKRFFELAIVCGEISWYNKSTLNKQPPSWRLYEHCLAVAVGTESLVAALGIEAPEFAFLTGYFHDVGKGILERCFSISSQSIIDESEEKSISIDEAERKILGIDHMEIGALLLEKWNLPSPIIEAVRRHHQPETFEGETLLVDLVHAADAIALMMGLGPQYEGLNYHTSSVVIDRLHLKVQMIENAIARIHCDLEPLRMLFAPFGKDAICQ